jgi:shikimate kinase
MPAAGKATVGRALAEKLGWPVYDIDDIMEAKEGKQSSAVQAEKGRDYVINLEAVSVNELDLSDSVLATPGSIIYATDCLDHMREQTHIVWLDVAVEVIKERLAYDPDNTRGVIGLKAGGLEQLFEERRPLYAKLAEIVINPEGMSPDMVADEIIARTNPAQSGQ